MGGLTYLAWLNRQLAGIVCGALLFKLGTSALFGKASRVASKRTQDALAESASVAEQTLSLIRVCRTFAAERFERARFADTQTAVLQHSELSGLAYGLSRLALSTASAALSGGVLAAGTLLAYRGAIRPDTLVTFFLYASFVSNASFDMSDQWIKIQEALGGASEIFALLDVAENPAAPLVTATATAAPAPPAAEKQTLVPVEFDNVDFTYANRPEVQVLDGFSLTVEKGETVAVVGPSGGGKSTLFKLLRGFYTAEGAITFGGRDVRTIPPEELAERVAWVAQDAQLFPVSIRDNIAYGLAPADAAPEAVEDAARAANAHKFISALPAGYDTLVGEGGTALSGGQRQRVSLARALLRDPEVLLLDEATSSLDAESERLVQDALAAAGAGRTTIVIAHRLSTVADASRILVVDGGRVVESGTPAELRASGGAYARLVAMQQLM